MVLLDETVAVKWNNRSGSWVGPGELEVEYPFQSPGAGPLETSPPMNVALWILQVVLAVMFAMSGIMKSTQPRRSWSGGFLGSRTSPRGG